MTEQEEYLPLHLKYRPRKLTDMVGNRITVKALQSMIDKPARPHAFLFTGPSGCGKTTLARIVATEMGVDKLDFIEMNSANYRGIDSIRELVSSAVRRPWKSENKFYLLDECFSEGTLIPTNRGWVPIEKVEVGDKILNVEGFASVKNTFRNKVLLNNIIKLVFSNGQILFTTKNHLFLTDNGWLKAVDVRISDLLLCVNSNTVVSTNLPITHKGKSNEKLRMVRRFVQAKKREAGNLLEKLCFQIDEQKKRVWGICTEKLRMVRGVFGFNSSFKPEAFLQPILCGQMAQQSAGVSRKGLHARIWKEDQFGTEKVFIGEPSAGDGFGSRVFQTHEREQPHVSRSNRGKDESDKTYKWNVERLAWGAWWKRKINRATSALILSFGLAHRVRDFFGKAKVGISNLLQSRLGKPEIEVGSRSGWERSSVEKSYIERCQKRKGFENVRLVSSEIYKPGCNDKSFSGVVDSEAKNEGCVIFYDLEIEGHPSYFANGLPVHNCHQITSDGQNALLKLLEEPPRHTYFALCTTEPEKLKATIKSRCASFPVESLRRQVLHDRLGWVCDEEKWDDKVVTEKTLTEISRLAKGCMRQALMMLDQVVELKEEDAIEALAEFVGGDHNVVELCRALAQGLAWKHVQLLLRSIKADGETVRLGVLGYFETVMLNEGELAPYVEVVRRFTAPGMNYTSRAGITLACWEIAKANAEKRHGKV